jgi:antitoxin CptB
MDTPPLHHNQIRWACRRGMLELDYFLLSFFDNYFETLSEAEQQCFVALLTEADQDLSNWLLHVTEPPAQFAALIQKIKDHVTHV